MFGDYDSDESESSNDGWGDFGAPYMNPHGGHMSAAPFFHLGGDGHPLIWEGDGHPPI